MVTDRTATTISLSWNPPIERDINGIIINYAIKYSVIEQLGVPSLDGTVHTEYVEGNEATLMGLFNFTTYLISISATTIAEGPAISLTQQTDENGLFINLLVLYVSFILSFLFFFLSILSH